MAEEKAWAEYWDGGDGAEAVGGEQRHKLASVWGARYEAASATTAPRLVVDIASGAGVALKSVLKAVTTSSDIYLALDVSHSALQAATRSEPLIIAAASDASKLPLRDGSAHFVISQFGIEYAGDTAFAEAARILAPAGRFCSISHYRGGAIDLECAENERLLDVLDETKLFAKARATFEASFARRSRRDPKPVDLTLDGAFAGALARVGSAVKAAPTSAAKATLERFTADLTRLSARRFAYEAGDALGWLDGMEASLGAYRKRMQSMRASALDNGRIAEVAALFEAAGLADFRAEPLSLDDHRPPAAWVIEARRPAAS